jgi:hypothetical protein
VQEKSTLLGKLKCFLGVILTLSVTSFLFSPVAFAATTITNTASANPVYTEDGEEVLIGTGLTFTGSSAFAGGYIDFTVGSAASTDILNLQKVSTAITTNGIVSVVGSTIYKGDGTNANPVASIDATFNGTAGSKLRIRFSSAFTNAGFETGDFTGWTYVGTWINIGVTTLAGVVSNDSDNTYPTNCSNRGINDNDEPVSATFSYEFASDIKTEGNKALRLRSTMTTKDGGDVVHGPAVVSDEFTAAAGDVISFDWRAYAGGDDFDAYGYLVNSGTGAQIEVIDANGSGTNWATKTTVIPSTGNYRFVFINGTHDLSCGRAAGGSLYIDNIVVAGSSVGEDLVQAISRLVTYKSTSNNPDSSRTVTIAPVPASGSITPINLIVDITAVDDGPVPSPVSISYTDTSASDDFLTSTGTISANDPDGGGSGGSITYGITGGTSASGSTTKSGIYGVLSVNESTGAYSYEPNDSVINRVVVNSNETFTITALSGALTGSATLTVNITGAAESSVLIPTVSGISPARGPNSGGTLVTITGTGFLTAQFVNFGTTTGTNLTIVSATQITVESPVKLAGTYNLTVVNDGGTNVQTNNFVYYIPTAPIAPTGVSATASNASGNISWTASDDATSYLVTSTPGGFTCTTSGTSCQVTGLTNGTSYTFSVIARNNAGNSAASTASSSITPSLPAPSTPTGLNATAGDQSAVISWTASLNSATYIATSNPGGFTCTTSTTTCNVTGLTNGTAYTFTVIGRNATGDSSPTSASMSITPTASVPIVSSITPNTGSTEGGTLITIVGSLFTGATEITFGGRAGTSLTVISDTQVTVITPSGSSGSVIVVVTTSSGSDTSALTFTYAAPSRPAPPSREIQSARNQELANRVSVIVPSNPTNPSLDISGPITINGVSNSAQIYVAPNELPKLPGFNSLKVNSNVIEVVPEGKFSGKMTVPVTISENGATITLNIAVVVNPRPVVEAKTSPINSSSTGVIWQPSPNAISYKVELNGQPLCASSGNSCSIPRLLGPNSKLQVTSIGNDGTISSQVIPAYVPGEPIPVLDVKFNSGSSRINNAEKRKLDNFIKVMLREGFTKLNIDAFTDGAGGTKGAKKLANSRATQVAGYLEKFLNVSIVPSGLGIAPEAQGSRKSNPTARKAQVSVL